MSICRVPRILQSVCLSGCGWKVGSGATEKEGNLPIGCLWREVVQGVCVCGNDWQTNMPKVEGPRAHDNVLISFKIRRKENILG